MFWNSVRHNRSINSVTAWIALAGLAFAPTAWADKAGPMALPTSVLLADMSEAPAEAKPAEASCPLSFGLSYALYSDYIFRGVNFSEYDGEGREKPNHQVTVSLAYDLGDFGSIGFDTWFEWYAAQKKINPDGGGQNLQEVDYAIWWGYGLEPIATDITLGVTFFQFPNMAQALRQDDDESNNGNDRTVEW